MDALSTTPTGPSVAPGTLAPGSSVTDRYLVTEVLGRGATGIVYGATDVVSSREVAIKVLHSDMVAEPLLAKRFTREATITQRLDHPNVVRVLGTGFAEGAPFIVMERISGPTLARWVAERGVPPLDVAIEIMAQVLAGLAAAHARGLVHRDVKPSNVLLSPRADGTPQAKLCDFGVAKAIALADGEVEQQTTLTIAGELCGTPAYMAPEQARGEALDARADLYAAGIVLFQLLTGKLPFQSKSVFALVSRHLTEAPAAPGSLVDADTIPPALDALVLRTLAKDRSARPASAEVFRAELIQIGRDLPAWRRARERTRQTGSFEDTAVAPTLVPGAPVAPRRRGLAIVGLASTVVAVAVLAAAANRSRPRAVVARPEPKRPRATLVTEPEPGLHARGGNPVAREVPVPHGPTAPTMPSAQRLRVRAAEHALRTASLPAVASMAAQPTTTAGEAMRDSADILQEADRLLADGARREACALGEEAKRLAPNRAEVFRFLGKCYLRSGDREAGRAHYERYLQLAPAAPDSPFVRGIVAP